MGLLKKFKRAVKKITKPVSRFLDKVVPNEIKPFLPYAAAAVPFLAPASGVFATMAGRAALSGGANILSQVAQEGNEGEISGLSALLAAGTGALAAPGTQKVVGVDKFNQPMNKRLSKKRLGLKDLIVIGYTGRIGREKDLFTLYRAFIRLQKKYPINLLIVGGGLKNIKKYLKTNQVTS